MDDLSDLMRLRLKKYREGMLLPPVKKEQVYRPVKQSNYVARKDSGDWGDDIRDHEAKQRYLDNQSFQNNPMYDGYRR